MQSGQNMVNFAFDMASKHIQNPTQENQDKVRSIFECFVESKIPYAEAAKQLSPLMANLDSLDSLGSIMKKMPQGSEQEMPSATSVLPPVQNPGGRQKSQRWTEAEDQKLLEGIQQHGLNNWGAIMQMVGNGRTRAQCSQRWNRVLNPKISKQNWTPEEEQKLLNAVQNYGPKAWTKVANEMGNRSDVQCRFKYNFLINKGGAQKPAAHPTSNPPISPIPNAAPIPVATPTQPQTIPAAVKEEENEMKEEMNPTYNE